MENSQTSVHFQLPDPETFVEEYGDYLFRYALVRLQNRELAEDVVQETLLAAIRSREGFAGKSSVKTWLVGILKHKILDCIWKMTREMPSGDLDSIEDPTGEFFDNKGNWKTGPSDWTLDPGAVAEQKEFWGIFARCLFQLPSRAAQIFAFRELEGLKPEEIRNLTGISSTNLGVIMHRARMRLRSCLETNWFGQGTQEE